jgi:hypothetical protein
VDDLRKNICHKKKIIKTKRVGERERKRESSLAPALH